MSKLIYLSGKYSGDVEANIEAARRIAVQLWSEGYWVLCPHLNTAGFEKLCDVPYESYIAGDLRMIDGVDAMEMLPAWGESKGAVIEHDYAIERGIPVYFWPTVPPLEPGTSTRRDESVLQEANRLVYGARQNSYGHPLDDFSRTAKIWSAILDVEVTAEQVALCMVGVKMSRECNKPKHDNRVDGAGYFATLDMVVKERAKRE